MLPVSLVCGKYHANEVDWRVRQLNLIEAKWGSRLIQVANVQIANVRAYIERSLAIFGLRQIKPKFIFRKWLSNSQNDIRFEYIEDVVYSVKRDYSVTGF